MSTQYWLWISAVSGKSLKRPAAYLEPTLGHEEVVFNTIFSKLVSNIKAHGAIVIVNRTFVLIIKNDVGIVDLFKPFSSLRVVRVLVGVIPECKFSESVFIVAFMLKYI